LLGSKHRLNILLIEVGGREGECTRSCDIHDRVCRTW